MQQAHNLCYKFDDGKICIFGHNIALLRSHIKKIVIAKANHCAKCRMQYECNMCFTPMQQAHNLCYKFDDGKMCIFGHNIALLRSHIKKTVVAKAYHYAKWIMQHERNMDFTPMQQTYCLCYKFDDGKICIFGHNVALLHSHIKRTVVAKACHCAKCRMQHKRNMCFTPMQQAHCLSYKIDDDKLCIFGHNILLLRSHIKKKLSLRHTYHCAKCRMQHDRDMGSTPMQQARCLCYKFDDDKNMYIWPQRIAVAAFRLFTFYDYCCSQRPPRAVDAQAMCPALEASRGRRGRVAGRKAGRPLANE